MISLSLLAERAVLSDRLHHPYTIVARRRGQLEAARACVTNEHLAAWVQESTALVNDLTKKLSSDEARVAAFEASTIPLEEAVAVEMKARAEYESAKEARALGSLDRRAALKLREDVEYADQALLIRRRETAACAQRVNSYLPPHDSVSVIEGRDFVEAIARLTLNRKFYPEKVGLFDRQRRLERMTESEFMGVPVWAAMKIESAKADAKTHEVHHASGTIAHDWRVEPIVMPIDGFVEELEKFKSSRAAHLKAKVRKAHEELALATERAASLEGGAA